MVGVRRKTARPRKGYRQSAQKRWRPGTNWHNLRAMNRRDFLLRSGAAASLGFLARGSLFAQNQTPPPSTGSGLAPAATAPKPAPPVTEFRRLRGNVGLFTGRGGTIGWLVNKEALVAVDTQFPDTAAIFLGGLHGRDGRMFDAVIDTHHHWDHTAGNKTFKPVARQLVAHQNVPKLQAAAAERNPQMGDPTFPDMLFADVWRKDVGDEVVSAQYFGPSHTGGDIVVHFERANVVHLGDLVFNRIYPVIDRPGGANVRHWLTALEEIAKTYPADAQYIFGHGKPAFGITGTQADLFAQRDFFTALFARVETEMKAGKSKEEIMKLANLPGFPDYESDPKSSRLPANLGAVYDELTAAAARG
jgi:cyclase